MADAPDPWVSRFLPLVPPGGRILDLACGSGRHGRLALAAGHPVTLVDRELQAVADLAEHAELIAADLEAQPWPLGERSFAAVIVVNYLWRPLLPAIRAAVAPHGLLIYSTFGRGQERFGRPRNPDFLLRPGELLAETAVGFRVLGYELVGPEAGGDSIRQSICARRLPTDTGA